MRACVCVRACVRACVSFLLFFSVLVHPTRTFGRCMPVPPNTQHQTTKSPTVCVRPYVTRDKQCSVRWTYETQRNHDPQNQFMKFTPNQQSISRQHITKTSAEVGVTFPPARPNNTTQQHYISRTPVPSKRKNVHTQKWHQNVCREN